jgi:hypothetical protein
MWRSLPSRWFHQGSRSVKMSDQRRGIGSEAEVKRPLEQFLDEQGSS